MNITKDQIAEIVSLIRQMANRKSFILWRRLSFLDCRSQWQIMPCYQFYHDDKFDIGNIEEEDELRFNEKTIFKDHNIVATSCEKC